MSLHMVHRKKKENDNPLHTEYGMVSNSLYALRKIRQYCPVLLVFMGIGAVAGSTMHYLWSFIGKYVIDIVQVQAATPEKDIAPLLRVVIVMTVIELACLLLDTFANNKMWHLMIYTRFAVISERVAKALSMNYQMLEQPKILDMHEKAMNATGGNNQGVEGLMHTVYDISRQLIVMLVSITAVAVLDWRLILILAALSLAQYLFFRYTVKKDRKNVWDKLAPTWRKIDYMTQTTQNFDYAKDIRLFHMKGWLSQKHHETLMEKQERMLYSRNLWIYNSIFGNGIFMLSQACVYGTLIYCVVDSGMSIGNFTLFLGLATTFFQSLRGLMNQLGTCKDRSMQVDDFRSFMDLNTDDDADCIPIPDTDTYTFEFQNVSYRYGSEDADENSGAYALRHLNLTLEAGRKLAVVGLNGAGKTTFIKLLLRLYDPTEGVILLNGIDIRKFRRRDYYRLFAPVFQNVEIFAFPISENVSMSRPADTDSARAKNCLVQAGMREKLESLTDGVDTQLLKIIHDNGIDLSGGERQKLALARALYKNAPVIVLDEPTAALDALAEYSLYQSFNQMIGGKSAVYISHRLSSTRFCDHVAMFREGELIEYGTHDALLKAGGAYAEMFEIQAQYYKDEEVAEIG